MTTTAVTLTATTTRPNDTTAYAAGDVIGQSPAASLAFTSPDVGPGASLMITGALIQTVQASIPSGMGPKRLHLFSRPPTAIADNAAFDVVAADRPYHLGYIDIQAPVQLGSIHEALALNPQAYHIKLDPDQRTVWGVLQTPSAYTPAAQTVRTIVLTAIEV